MKISNTSESKTKIICTVVNDLTTDQRMHRICDALIQAGYEVTLVGRELPNSRSIVPRSFAQKRLKCIFHKGFLFYMEYNIRLWIFLLFNKFHIVNAIDLDTILPAWSIARLKGKKVVYDAHEWFPYCPEIVYRPFVHRFWLKIEQCIVPKVDAAYTVSQSIAEALSSQYQLDFGLVRNMPIQRIATKTKGEPYILYQGALNVGRGLEQMISAMSQIDIPLYIAGTGDIEDALRQQVMDMNLQGRIQFLGQLTPDELWKFTQNAYLGLNLLENLGQSYYYSLSNKFFDYIQAGVPQVTMNFPEYKILNEEYEVAVLLENLDLDQLIKAILQLVDDEHLYSRLKANCLIAKEIWNWEQEQLSLCKIYEQLENR